MVWDSTGTTKTAKRQGFFKNKDGLADKPNRGDAELLTQTVQNNYVQQHQQQNGQHGMITPRGNLSSNPIASQSPRPDNYSLGNAANGGYGNAPSPLTRIGGGGGGVGPAAGGGGGVGQSPSIGPSSLSAANSPHSKGDRLFVTDKITGARTWSNDQIGRTGLLPPPSTQGSPSQQQQQARERSDSYTFGVGARPQQLQPNPLPAGYDPRHSLNNSLNVQQQQQQQQHVPHPPAHLPPINGVSSAVLHHQQQQPLINTPSRRISGNDAVGGMANPNPYANVVVMPMTNGGYTMVGGGGGGQGGGGAPILQINPAPSNDLVQLVMSNYQEAQRSYLQV